MLATIAPDGTIIPAGGTKEWLYRLVTFPLYFTPCPSCCGINRTPKREQLVTLFDTDFPTRVYCSHCPEHKERLPGLLQVRRSAFKDVVKATDILRFGADIAGVQQYTLNGSKVIYLNRDQAGEKKASGHCAAPATCIVDGRAMMDRSSLYCSLKCKMAGEDADFVDWQLAQDAGLQLPAPPAGATPQRPVLPLKRMSPGSTPGSPRAGAGAVRPKKAARSGDAAPGAKPRAPSAKQLPPLSKAKGAAGAADAPTASVLQIGGVPSGLRPIRTSTIGDSTAAFAGEAAGPLDRSASASLTSSDVWKLPPPPDELMCDDWRMAASPTFALLGQGYLDGVDAGLQPPKQAAAAGDGDEWWLTAGLGSPSSSDPFDAGSGLGSTELIDLDSDHSDAGLLLHWPPFSGPSPAAAAQLVLPAPPAPVCAAVEGCAPAAAYQTGSAAPGAAAAASGADDLLCPGGLVSPGFGDSALLVCHAQQHSGAELLGQPFGLC